MSSKYNGAGVSPETFQEIISERMAEVKGKTELKRLYDLKRIQEMKSTKGKDPTEIFPEEVWRSILHLVNPVDRGNIWKIHGEFRDFMSSTHVRDNLFPQVLTKAETFQFWKDDDDFPRVREYEEDDYGDKAAAPFAKAPLANYLELRLVSKSLREEVDRFIEVSILDNVHQVFLQWTPDSDRTIFFQFDQYCKPSRVTKELDKVLGDLEVNPKSRFFSRSLNISLFMRPRTISDSVLEQFARFNSKLLQFLQQAGGQLWYLELATFDDSLNRNRHGGGSKLHVPFNEWLSLMPNLKWLNFRHFCESESGSCFDFQFRDLQNQSEMKNLERIDLEVRSPVKNEADSYCKSILEAHPHVKVLRMDGDKLNYGVVSTLKSLEGMDINFGGNFFKMEKITNSSWPLKRMALTLDLDYDSIIPLFKFLDKFPTLEQVKLELDKASIGGGIDFLRLTNLKEFHVDIKPRVIYIAPINFFFSLQFLLYSKNLTKLWWKCELQCDVGKADKRNLERVKLQPEGMIGFGGGWVNLTDSNIWKVFPYLEHVETRVKVNTDWRLIVIDSAFREYHKRTLINERVYHREVEGDD